MLRSLNEAEAPGRIGRENAVARARPGWTREQALSLVIPDRFQIDAAQPGQTTDRQLHDWLLHIHT